MGICVATAPASPVWADGLDKIAKKISSAAKKLENKKVAVLPFPTHDGRSTLGSTIVSERLITKVSAKGKLEVIERSLLQKVLQELELGTSGVVDASSAKKLGQVLGVEAIVSGTLISLPGGQVEVNARLIQAQTGRILVASSGRIDKVWQDAISMDWQSQTQTSVSSAAAITSQVDPDCGTCAAPEAQELPLPAIVPPVFPQRSSRVLPGGGRIRFVGPRPSGRRRPR